MARIIVFDVNQTLLDTSALEPHFERAFGDAALLHEWFTTTLLYSEAATLAGPYADFGTIARAALDMIATAHGVTVSAADRATIADGLRSLPPHADARPSLELLRAAGIRVVSLTNSGAAASEAQLEHAGLAELFERRFSVDAIQRFKPAPAVYRMVASEMGVPASGLRMVAVHPWDVIGAMRAGCAGAFVARPGHAWFPLAPEPDIVGSNLMEVAEAIARAESAGATV